MTMIHSQLNISRPEQTHFRKKKYSKVTQTLKKEFLACIIQHNMSIKEASHNLNINYSSAKAILASHRKSLKSSRNYDKKGQKAIYRPLSPVDGLFGKFLVICSTGGYETSTFDQFEKQGLTYKPSKACVILLKTEKDVINSQNTENQCSQ